MARILIIDDSEVMRRLLRNILEEAGHEVVGEADNGAQGMIKFAQLRPDMLTLDITMPKLNGLNCLKVLMERFPEAKVLMLTADSQGQIILEAMEAGASHYVTKPFESEAVIEAVNDVLDSAFQPKGKSGSMLSAWIACDALAESPRKNEVTPDKDPK